MQIKALDNQTLLDLSIYLFGTAVGALELAIVNNISLTDDVQAGQLLEIPKNFPLTENLVAEYFQNQQLKPATGVTAIEKEIELPSGIDYWAIEVDFEIQ